MSASPTMNRKPIASLSPERRQGDRRESIAEAVLSVLEAFDAEERTEWRRLDRRMTIRRERDVRARIARQR